MIAGLGWLSLLSLAGGIMAAVLAIDLYALLRTSKTGVTWRVLIIASLLFLMTQVLRLAEYLSKSRLADLHLSEISQLMFVMALAYAFWLQKRVFSDSHREPKPSSRETPSTTAPSDASGEYKEGDLAEEEWARLSGKYMTPVQDLSSVIRPHLRPTRQVKCRP